VTDPAHTRAWVSDVVRSGLLGPTEEYAEVRAVIASDHRDLDADATARAWIDEAHAAWTADAAAWSDPTDFDRLRAAFAELDRRGFVVLEGCADHWAAKDALVSRPGCRGAVWFLPSDVWHAIDEAMLEINLWHPDTANVTPGEALLDEVLAVFIGAGLGARFDEGRIEVAARWQRRPA
jgi:hypothetical protein